MRDNAPVNRSLKDKPSMKKLLAIALIAALMPVLAQAQSNLSGGTSSSSTSLRGIPSCLDVTPACVSDNTVLDASTTASSNIVTCPNADCKFLTTAAVGQLVQGGTLADGIVLNITTILSVDSDTQIPTVGNATLTRAGLVYLGWGPENTASREALHDDSAKL